MEATVYEVLVVGIAHHKISLAHLTLNVVGPPSEPLQAAPV